MLLTLSNVFLKYNIKIIIIEQTLIAWTAEIQSSFPEEQEDEM